MSDPHREPSDLWGELLFCLPIIYAILAIAWAAV